MTEGNEVGGGEAQGLMSILLAPKRATWHSGSTGAYRMTIPTGTLCRRNKLQFVFIYSP